jgi:hypothetical protein
MPSPFVHLELSTPDLKKAKDFYGQLCGWTFNDAPMPPPINTYSIFNPGTDVQEVPGHGWMSILIDPTGASIALWQGKQA